jgi:hypothetical protein
MAFLLCVFFGYQSAGVRLGFIPLPFRLITLLLPLLVLLAEYYAHTGRSKSNSLIYYLWGVPITFCFALFWSVHLKAFFRNVSFVMLWLLCVSALLVSVVIPTIFLYLRGLYIYLFFCIFVVCGIYVLSFRFVPS